MDREKLFRHLEQRYTSKRDLISRIPLGTQPDALWQELLNQRRSRSTVLPLYNYKGLPYWFVTTDKMVAASEKIIEALYENEREFDPYTETLPVSTLEEVFYTSYVEGSQISIQDAMDFLANNLPPRDIEEQMIINNRQAGSYASSNLYRPIDAEYLKELVYLLTDGMDQGGQDYRSTNEVDLAPASGEQFEFPSVRTIPDRLSELSTFLELPNMHPLIKAAVAQAYLMILRPFPEGNERLGRMVSTIILLRTGYTFFSETSLSALIARRSYSYYEAMFNILREENGCDLTYFIEYYLELLSRAVDERRLKQRQKEEQSRQAEMALARTPLIAATVPATDSASVDSDTLAASDAEITQTCETPTEADPNLPEKGGENNDWLPADSWIENKAETDTEISKTRIRDEFLRFAANSGPIMKTGAKFMLSLMDKQVHTFTVDDIIDGCGFTAKQAANYVTHIREMGLIESVGKRNNRCMIYQFATAQPHLEQSGRFATETAPPERPPMDDNFATETVAVLPEGYSKDVLVQLDILSESSTSNRDRRVSEVLRSCLAKGTLLRRDYEERGYTGNMWLSDTALATQLGLITKQPDGGYIINRELQTEFSNLKPHQKKAITAIYEAFGYDAFSSEMFVATLNYSVSYTYASLHKLTLLRILEQKVTDEGCQYQLLVNPEDHPECFIEAA